MENIPGQSDESVFERLITAHGRTLARYIRFRIGNTSDAEDVLQETLVAAWLGFPHVRQPNLLPAWLIQVAQNRCRDYFRARERREVALDEPQLHRHADRFGLRAYRQNHRVEEILDALDHAPPAAREAARRFYLDGLSIAEIAADTQRPPGTIKRQLFLARQSARAALGIPHGPSPQPEKIMSASPQSRDTVRAKFPNKRPRIEIAALRIRPFAIDCRELRSWPIIPEIGEHAAAAEYSLPDWQIEAVTALRAHRTATVHAVEGLEIEVEVWNRERGWESPGAVYARLTADRAEFLAIHLPQPESTQIETFLDETFTQNWGTLERRIADTDYLTLVEDGTYRLAPDTPIAPGRGLGAGLARVTIGDIAFICRPVLESPSTTDLANADDILNIAYITEAGCTVLIRRYCRPRFVDLAQYPVLLDKSEGITINGVTFSHWYDILTDAALGPKV